MREWRASALQARLPVFLKCQRHRQRAVLHCCTRAVSPRRRWGEGVRLIPPQPLGCLCFPTTLSTRLCTVVVVLTREGVVAKSVRL